MLVILGRIYTADSKEDDPLAQARHVRSFAMAARVSVLIDSGITLFKLCVDDFARTRQVIRTMLSKNCDLEVVGQATDGLEALHWRRSYNRT